MLCHGFPESWYSWRHQLHALADAGFHSVAPDQRGYGTTDAPEPIEAYSLLYLVGDIVGLVHALGEESAVVVGHDWGAPVAWAAAQWRPDMFRAVASLSVPTRRRSHMAPLELLGQLFGDRFFYQIYFQTPGVAEHELQHDVGLTVRKMLYGASGSGEGSALFDPTNSPPNTAFMLEQLQDPGDNLPNWLTQEDVGYYTTEFERTGFRGGLNWYRNIDRGWELTAAFDGKTINQPAGRGHPSGHRTLDPARSTNRGQRSPHLISHQPLSAHQSTEHGRLTPRDLAHSPNRTPRSSASRRCADEG